MTRLRETMDELTPLRADLGLSARKVLKLADVHATSDAWRQTKKVCLNVDINGRIDFLRGRRNPKAADNTAKVSSWG